MTVRYDSPEPEPHLQPWILLSSARYCVLLQHMRHQVALRSAVLHGTNKKVFELQHFFYPHRVCHGRTSLAIERRTYFPFERCFHLEQPVRATEISESHIPLTYESLRASKTMFCLMVHNFISLSMSSQVPETWRMSKDMKAREKNSKEPSYFSSN